MQNSELLPIEIPALLAPFWAPRGHLQTLAGHFIPSASLPSYGEPHEVVLPDGDRMLIYVTPGRVPVVLSQFHGLAGDMSADYMRRGAAIAQKFGLTHVYVNQRGAGPGLALAKSSYHSGRAEDMSAVLQFLRKKFPSQKQIAIGYSMSANILLLLLSGIRGGEKPDGAIAVNGPIDLREASSLLGKGMNRIYDQNFILSLQKMLREKHKRGLINEKYHFPLGSGVWDFDEIYTAKASGFRSREHYYEESSSFKHVHHIQTPTYVLTSADDPFVNVQAYLKAAWSSKTKLTISPLGGHLGYFDRRVLSSGNHRWLDVYIAKAIENLLKQT